MSMLRTGTRIAVVFAFGAVLFAQAPSTLPSFRVGSELVVVDLIPTAASRFVADLTPADIQVLEDGKPRPIQFLDLVGTDDPGADEGMTSNAPPTTTRESSAAIAREPARVVVAVDMLAMPPDDLPKVQDAVVKLVQDELPHGTDVMVVSFSRAVTIEQAFTSDKQAVVTAIRRLRPQAAGRLGFLDMIDNAMRECGSGGLLYPSLVVAGKSYIHEARLDLAFSSAALATLTASLAPLPGRKHIVLYSRGYPLDPVPYTIELVASVASMCGGGNTDYRHQATEDLSAEDEGSGVDSPFRTLVDRANRAQVSFYAVDARSLFVTSVQARDSVTARASRGGLVNRVLSTEGSLPQEYLRSIAGDTGGRAFLNSNDLSQGLRRAWTDARRYYLVGFAPDPHRKKGGYHKIEVKVARPGVDLRFRRAYYDMTEKEVADADVARALAVPGMYQQAGLEAEAIVQRGKLRVTAFVPPSAVHFDAAADRHVAAISVHAALRHDNGKLVGGKNLFDRDITLRLSAEQRAHLTGSDNIEIPVEVPLPKVGSYSLTIAARASGGWVGTQVVPLTIK